MNTPNQNSNPSALAINHQQRRGQTREKENTEYIHITMVHLEVFQNEPTEDGGGDYYNAANTEKLEPDGGRSDSSGGKAGGEGGKKSKKKKGSKSKSSSTKKNKKKGSLFMGCCCDMRRACIIVNIVNMMLMILLDILVINIIAIPQVIALMILLTIVSCVFSVVGIMGAIKYNKWMVIAAATWYCIAILINISNKDLISAVVSGIFAYAHYTLVQEIRHGIMSKENYPNEIHSCCCV